MNTAEMDQVLSLLSTLTAEVASLEQQMLCIRTQIEDADKSEFDYRDVVPADRLQCLGR